MIRYKLTVAYDGTDYHGWQAQPGKITIAGTMQDAIKRVFGCPVTLVGASRTDAGVHAQGQIATCLADFPQSTSAIAHAWNNQLPRTIAITSLEVVPPEHSIFASIAYKTYVYRIFLARPCPLEARYGWYTFRKINTDILKQSLQIFVGTHDFRSFSTGNEREDTVRSIDSIEVLLEQNSILVVIKGPKFLHHMIRRIVGAACDVASRADFSVDYLVRVLHEKNPRQRLTNAPAQGLTLQSITYKESL